MAREKRPSDELRNARRRVQRMAERAERSGDKGEAERLRDIVAGSYMSSGKDMASLRAKLDAIYATRHLTRKPTASNTQGTSGKMPRKKRPSDELRNARRRVQRMAERAERSGDKGEAERLRDIVAGSYMSSGKDMASLRAKLDAIYATRHLTRKPTASNTQGTSGKMPRKKRPGDELYNARRRLEREADSLERRAKGMVGAEREATLGYAKYLREQALPTGRLNAEQREKALERLQNLRERSYEGVYGKDATLRRNMIFKQQMNAAGTEGADSSISERKKDVFWMATKGLWPKGSQVPRNERYERIIEHFYRDQTTDAREFRAWLESRGIDITKSFGDLQFIYEYVTEVLNDPQMYEAPEMPYQDVANVVRMAM